MTTPLIHLFRQAEDYFFRGISERCLDLGSEATAYMTRVQVADLNLVYIRNNPKALDKILHQSKQFYDQDKLSFVIIIPQTYCTLAMQNKLKTMGYAQTDQSVAMAINLETWIPITVPGFDEDITIKATDHQLNDWMLPLIGAFESTFEISSQYTNTHANALKNKIGLHHFSVYQQSKPIASMTLSVHDTVARVDDVGTLPQFQGKGYATCLMSYALLEARKLGATDCFLESSDSGLAIYQKLGFKKLFKNNIYSYSK